MFKENPTYQLAGTLAVVFAAFVLQVKNMPFLDVKERAHLMREEAEQKILDEILRLERQSLLVRVNGSSYSKIMHSMRTQIDEQEKILSKHRNDHFNLNTVELTLLGCAVTLCLSGIMFDSPFLSDGSTPLRGVVLSYFILSLIILSMIYFVLAFVWEIKQSKIKRKTKRQVLWSKIKGMKHKVVENAKKQQKQSKLQGLLSKSKNVEKASPFNIKSLQSIVPKASVLNTSRRLEKNLNKSSSTSSSSSGVHSSSDSDISINSGNVSLVDLLSRESSGESSSSNNSGNIKQSSSSSSATSSSAAISSSEKSDSEVSYEASSTSENEESSAFEHESQSNDSNYTVNSNSDIEVVGNTSTSNGENSEME